MIFQTTRASSFFSLSIGALLILISITTAVTIMVPNAYAVRFDTDTGTGFITKGELQKALGMNDAQLQQEYQNEPFSILLRAEMYWNVVCSDGEILEHNGGGQEFWLNSQPVTNPQGKLTGIELTGYREPDAFNRAIIGGPGSVCNFGTETSWTLDEIGDLFIIVDTLHAVKYIPIH